jgi:hypothetical protein
MRVRCFLLLTATLFPVLIAAASNAAGESPLASAERKLQHIESNGTSPHPDPTPTEFTENEINAYFAAGKVALPAGVKSVRFQLQPRTVSGNARVDFDQFRSGIGSYNPLLSVFTGVHDVLVAAHAHGSGGQAYIEVDSVSLDGVEIPRFALQLFVEKFVQPRYPGIGLSSRFGLPDRIDTATIASHRLTVVQK